MNVVDVLHEGLGVDVAASQRGIPDPHVLADLDAARLGLGVAHFLDFRVAAHLEVVGRRLDKIERRRAACGLDDDALFDDQGQNPSSRRRSGQKCW